MTAKNSVGAVFFLHPDQPGTEANVVDLMRPQPHTEHPHGLDDVDFDMLYTKEKPDTRSSRSAGAA
jgi:phosphoketolase